MAKSPGSIRRLALEGALGDACLMFHQGFQRPALIKRLALDYPRWSRPVLEAVVDIAQEACAAAALINMLPRDTPHGPDDCPCLPE